MILKFISFFLVINSVLFLNMNFLFSQNAVEDSLFVYIEGGTFYIGSKTGDEDEKPMKKIQIDEFYISKYEITNRQYTEFLNALKPGEDRLKRYIKINGSWLHLNCKINRENDIYKVVEGYENYPVNFVSWYGANAYCKYYEYRLPTEAEWEYVAKGGRNNLIKRLFKNYKEFSGNDEAFSVAWYKENSEREIHEVGLKYPNEVNVFDMSGNLDEWCNDWYLPDYYSEIDIKNPLGPSKADFKIIRGGSWYNSEKMIRITNRRASNPKSKKVTIGFRVVKDIAVFYPVQK